MPSMESFLEFKLPGLDDGSSLFHRSGVIESKHSIDEDEPISLFELAMDTYDQAEEPVRIITVFMCNLCAWLIDLSMAY